MPGHWGNVILHGKEDLEGVIRLRTLRWGDYPGWYRWGETFAGILKVEHFPNWGQSQRERVVTELDHTLVEHIWACVKLLPYGVCKVINLYCLSQICGHFLQKQQKTNNVVKTHITPVCTLVSLFSRHPALNSLLTSHPVGTLGSLVAVYFFLPSHIVSIQNNLKSILKTPTQKLSSWFRSYRKIVWPTLPTLAVLRLGTICTNVIGKLLHNIFLSFSLSVSWVASTKSEPLWGQRTVIRNFLGSFLLTILPPAPILPQSVYLYQSQRQSL